MQILEKATELIGQYSAMVSVSIMDLLGSYFIRFVTFFVNLLLGL